MDEETFTFGPFRLIPARHMLLEDGKPLRLGSRALDILVTLVESAGETVRKDQLIARTWPDTVVDEGTLRVHVAALRKVLGDGRGGMRYIANVPGRGYTFVAPVVPEQRETTITPPDGVAVKGNLSMPLTRILGRDDVIEALKTQLSRRRFLTIVGPGGIGKTTVAIAVAQNVSASYKDGVWFIALSSLSDPELVPSALTAVLGISLSGVNLVSGLTAWLRDKHCLIVLDNCEHVLSAAAKLAERILTAAPRTHILATSREPLRAEGEWLHRLSSLEVPPESTDVTSEDALHYPAVELFNERVNTIVEGITFSAADLQAVIEICRRLDGVPLALELAAARVDVFGIRGLAARLDDRFSVLTRGRRTALPRHQTLRATMDWSYDLLPEAEQLILKRLAVLRGDFTMDAAVAVATDDRIKTTDVLEGVADLATKSLVATDIGREPTFHRLLDTTRAYTLEKLTESGELERVTKRHAEYYRTLFERAEAEQEMRPTAEWVAEFGSQIENLRAALDWAFSPDGDSSIGVALTAAAVPLWMQLSLVDECRSRAEQALAALGENRGDPRGEMKVHAALAASLMYIRGAGVSEVGAAWAKAFELAENLADTEFQLRSLYGLWAFHINGGRQRAALQLAQRCCTPLMSSSEPFAKLLGERMLGVSEHHLGDQSCARRRLEGVLAAYVISVASVTSDYRQIVRFQSAPQVTAGVFLARTLWLQGDADQAVRIALNSVQEARAANHANSLGYALSLGACPIALWRGDLDMADDYVRMLLDHSTRYGLSFWLAFGRCYQGQLVIRRGDVTTGLQLLRTGLSEFIEGNTTSRFIAAQMAEALYQAGRIGEGLAVIEGAIERSQSDEELWATAELLRIKGELVRMDAIPEASAAAEEQFRQALELSRQQGALSWELRAAISLAQMLRDQGRSIEAFALLQPVYDRFTEGFDTADLREAKSLLEHLT